MDFLFLSASVRAKPLHICIWSLLFRGTRATISSSLSYHSLWLHMETPFYKLTKPCWPRLDFWFHLFRKTKEVVKRKEDSFEEWRKGSGSMGVLAVWLSISHLTYRTTLGPCSPSSTCSITLPLPSPPLPSNHIQWVDSFNFIVFLCSSLLRPFPFLHKLLASCWAWSQQLIFLFFEMCKRFFKASSCRDRLEHMW